MALTTESFNANGSQRSFTISSTVLSESHIRVHYYYDGVDHAVASDEWDLLSDTLLFNTAPTSGYVVKITVSSDGEGLDDAPTDISSLADNIDYLIIVSDNIDSVVTVATYINDIGTAGDFDDRLSSVETKLSGIENGATADQTATEIKTLYLSNSDTNNFDNTYKSKLDGIQSRATLNSTDAQLRDRATHTGTQSISTITESYTGKIMTADERTKLAGIATEANNYVHPLTHPVSIIDGTANAGKFVQSDTSGNTVFDYVLWTQIGGKPSSFTPSSHTHNMAEITSGNLDASRITTSNSLTFVTTAEKSLINTAEQVSQKGQANGYCPLDSNGKINASFLNNLQVIDVFTVDNEAEMLLLGSAGVGDIALRTDENSAYMLKQLPSSDIDNWFSLSLNIGVTEWNGLTSSINATTSDLPEGTNLYFTDERVDDRVGSILTAGTNVSISYDDNTGLITISANDTSVSWTEVTSKPTTISGYAITDAYTKTEVNTLAGNYYTKSQVNALADTYYTKTEIDNRVLDDIHDVALSSPISGQVLSYNGDEWTNVTLDALPSQSGNGGKYLTTDGTDASWAELETDFAYSNDTIPVGDSVTIPSGKQLVVDHLDVQGTLDIQGTLATVSGGYLSQTTMKTESIINSSNSASPVDFPVNPTIDGINVSPFTGFKNRIINGNFDVWQRGTSFTPTIGGTYTADRWIAYGNGVMTFLMAQVVDENKYLHINYVNGQVCAVGQRLECNAGTIANFSNKKFTMSFKTRFNVLPTQAISWGVLLKHTLGSATLVQGSINYVLGSQTVSVTFTIPDLSGYVLDNSSFIEFRPFLNFASENVPTQAIGLYGVQLEEGSVATPFEHRPYGLELSLCQRYYEKILTSLRAYADGYGFYWTIPMKVNKRNTPSVIQGTSYTGANVSQTTSVIGVSQENIAYRLVPNTVGFCNMDNLSLEIISEL